MSSWHYLDKHCVVSTQQGTAAISPAAAQALLQQVPGWEISADGKWLLKAYKFKNFVTALAFVGKVGEVAEAEQNHHPDLELGWGYVRIKLQTHAAEGLHENDFITAAKIEKIQ